MLRSVRSLGLAAAVVSLCFVMFSVGQPVHAQATLTIDHAEAPEFEKDAQIRIFFDLLDQERKVVRDLTPAEVTSITIDGDVVEGDIDIKTYAEAKEWVGLAILMAAHNTYNLTHDALDEGEEGTEGGGEEGSKMEATPSTYQREKQGIANLVRKLSGSDSVAVWRYHEKGLRDVVAWTGNFQAAARKVEAAEACGDCKDAAAPRLYDALKEVVNKVKAKAEADDGFPRRKIVLIMTDGSALVGESRKRLEQKTEQIVNLAREAGVKIYVIGYTEEDTEKLIPISGVASSTKGVYLEIPHKESGDTTHIPEMVEAMGEEIKRQYVLTLSPNTEKFRGAEKPVKIRVETSKNGETAGGEIEGIKINVIPTDWWSYIKWVLIGLGALIGLWLFIKMIKAIIAARANRPVEVVYEEDDGPVGPYKGKLTVLEGTYVGAEFYLTEDVTTIGAMDGNSIVLEAPGVSKRHAGIKIEDMRFELADFGSTNGTHVNGNKITKQFLRDQDSIRIGDCKMKFSLK